MAGNVEVICPTLQRKSATSWHDGQLEHAHARGWREFIGFTAANIINLLQTSSVIKKRCHRYALTPPRSGWADKAGAASLLRVPGSTVPIVLKFGRRRNSKGEQRF
jgi:hypothetical protein